MVEIRMRKTDGLKRRMRVDQYQFTTANNWNNMSKTVDKMEPMMHNFDQRKMHKILKQLPKFPANKIIAVDVITRQGMRNLRDVEFKDGRVKEADIGDFMSGEIPEGVPIPIFAVIVSVSNNTWTTKK